MAICGLWRTTRAISVAVAELLVHVLLSAANMSTLPKRAVVYWSEELVRLRMSSLVLINLVHFQLVSRLMLPFSSFIVTTRTINHYCNFSLQADDAHLFHTKSYPPSTAHTVSVVLTSCTPAVFADFLNVSLIIVDFSFRYRAVDL